MLHVCVHNEVYSHSPPIAIKNMPNLPPSLQEKCKYELVTGQWKTSQEVISIYSDLLSSHPGVYGYIDPLHHKVFVYKTLP